MFDAEGVHLLTDQASTYQDVAGRTDTIQVILNTEPALRFNAVLHSRPLYLENVRFGCSEKTPVRYGSCSHKCHTLG